MSARKRSGDTLRASEEQYRLLFDSIDEGFCIIEVLFDSQETPIDYKFLRTNPAFERQTGLAGAVGRSMLELVPEHEKHWFEIYGRIALTGEPERFESRADALGRWYDVYAFRIGEPEKRRVAILFRDVLESKRAEQVLRESEARQAFLLKLSDALRPLGDPAEIQSTAMRVLGEHLGVLRAQYWEADADDEYIVSTGGYADGVAPVLARVLMDDFGTFIKENFRAGRKLVVADAWTDDRVSETERESYDAFGFRAFLSIPLVKNGRFVAVLGLHHATPRDWTDAEVSLAEETAERTWATVERARAEEALRRSEERHGFLLELSDALRTLGDPLKVQAVALRVLGRHLNADRVFYAEVDEELGEYVINRNYTNGVPPLIGHFRISDIAQTARISGSGQVMVISDVESDPRLPETERATYAKVNMAAAIGIPLLKDGRLVVGLGVQQATPRKWTAEEVSLARETAERTWAAVERARAEEALRDADRRKDEFLATLAHELRNPLAPLRTGLELMRITRGMPPTAGKAHAMMERQVNQLVRLVDDLMDLSRITRGRIQLRLEQVDLNDVARDAAEAARAFIEASGHDLAISLPGEPVFVSADPSRLVQVVGNLLNNATKYTAAGGRIELEVTASGSGASVTVRDNGLGIAPDQLTNIFNMFSQVDPSLEKSSGGLGIGLTLVKQIVELHAGSVTAHSDGIGQGATFTVHLPLSSAPAAPAPLKESEQATATARRRLLVVDDNRDAAESLAKVLEMSGHEVRTAGNGLQALEAAETFRPDVVLLDIAMPGLNGYDTARRLRAKPWGKGLMLIALSGWAQDQVTRDAGFDHHLLKPVEIARLKPLLGQPRT